MARALTFCKTGVITIAMIQESKESGKPIVFAKTTNKASGKESSKETAFSFVQWGEKTMEYLAMIQDDLHETSRRKIIEQAYEKYKNNQRSQRSISVSSMDIDEPQRPRRCIRDLSDDED